VFKTYLDVCAFEMFILKTLDSHFVDLFGDEAVNFLKDWLEYAIQIRAFLVSNPSKALGKYLLTLSQSPYWP
jgi:hypothetical protein